MTPMFAQARHWMTSCHFAQLGILAQMLAGFRAVGEYFRLEWAGAATQAVIAPLLLGAMIAIGGAFVSAILYFFGRNRLSLALTLTVIASLIVYRLAMLPSLG